MRALFDAHLHIIEPRFPLVPNHGFVPDPFTVSDYRRAMAGFEVQGGVVVAGSFQGTGTAWLTAALRQLGPQWFGVAQLDGATSNASLLELDAAGVRATRINLHRGDPADARAQFGLAVRAWDIAGWHCELYVDCARLGEHQAAIDALPRVVIDHLGLSAAGIEPLLKLVSGGAKVKATGFGRLDFDAARAMQRIVAVDPAALMFGSDLPGTRAPRPFDADDVTLILDALGEPLARRVLLDNAAAFYSR